MLEVPIGVEMKTDQNGYNLEIGYHPFYASLGCAHRGGKSTFRHLFFKFLAKIIRNTKKSQ